MQNGRKDCSFPEGPEDGFHLGSYENSGDNAAVNYRRSLLEFVCPCANYEFSSCFYLFQKVPLCSLKNLWTKLVCREGWRLLYAKQLETRSHESPGTRKGRK